MTRASRIMNGVTEGVSPKAVAAFLYPLIATVGSTVASWIVTGDFNDSEIRVGLSGLVLSSVAALGAALGKTGVINSDEPPEIDHSEDEDVGPVSG